MKKKNLNFLLALLAALALVFAGACSDGDSSSESVDVSGTYSGTSIATSGSDAGNVAIAAAVQKFDEAGGTFTASSLSIELDGGSYTAVVEGYWTWTGDFYYTYTMTGSYTVSGSTITLGEPTVSIVYYGTDGISGNGTSLEGENYTNSVAAIKAIIANTTLTYSNGSLVMDIDYSALDELVGEDEE